MTPEQWQNVADCARQRWEARVEASVGATIPDPERVRRRVGEFDSWLMAVEMTERAAQ